MDTSKKLISLVAFFVCLLAAPLQANDAPLRNFDSVLAQTMQELAEILRTIRGLEPSKEEQAVALELIDVAVTMRSITERVVSAGGELDLKVIGFGASGEDGTTLGSTFVYTFEPPDGKILVSGERTLSGLPLAVREFKEATRASLKSAPCMRPDTVTYKSRFNVVRGREGTVTLGFVGGGKKTIETTANYISIKFLVKVNEEKMIPCNY